MGWFNETASPKYHEGDPQFGDIEYPEPSGVGYTPDGIGSWVIGPPTIPPSVTMAQAQAALYRSGMLDQVQAAVDAAKAGGDIETDIFWRKANTVERDSTFVTTLATVVGLTSLQVDQLFITASNIP